MRRLGLPQVPLASEAHKLRSVSRLHNCCRMATRCGDMPHTGMSVRELARFAAALGRSDQAVQIATASAIDVQVNELLDTAVRAVRNRPDIDLRGLLAGAVLPEITPEAVKALRASTQNLVLSPHVNGLDIHLQDPNVAVGTATFFDVSLQGQDRFSASFTALDGSNCTVRASIIDQSTGALLERQVRPVLPGWRGQWRFR